MNEQTFNDLPSLAEHLRDELDKKEFILLYAHNGVGKTRLSMEFKDYWKRPNNKRGVMARDTLYFNAYTEDLFIWDNDLDNDSERVLLLNSQSRFFKALDEVEMDNRIRPLLERYADFDFRIDTEKWEVSFSREVLDGDRHYTEYGIKVSRGEEKIFIWCFFLAIVQLALDDDDGSGPYGWVKYIYIDDPISSLDDQNAVAIATHLAGLLKNRESRLKTVISTHHSLFFNVLYNELNCNRGRRKGFFLTRDRSSSGYRLQDTSDTPFFYHLAALVELHEAVISGDIHKYHFNMLRTILEKTASFHGYKNFSACISQIKDDQDKDDLDDKLYTRLINLHNHGNYSPYEPWKMQEGDKEDLHKILKYFTKRFLFNKQLLSREEPKKENSNP